MPNHCSHPTGDLYELEATALIADPDAALGWGDDDLLNEYVDVETWYQYTSDDEAYFRYYRLIKDYEFQERGGLLPGDTVSANIYPDYWWTGVVLLVGDKTLIVACDVELERNKSKWECFEVNLDQATWMPD